MFHVEHRRVAKMFSITFQFSKSLFPISFKRITVETFDDSTPDILNKTIDIYIKAKRYYYKIRIVRKYV